MDQFVIKEHNDTMIVLFLEQFNWWPKLDGLAFDSIDVVEPSTTAIPNNMMVFFIKKMILFWKKKKKEKMELPLLLI
jgi:hypothetical protein